MESPSAPDTRPRDSHGRLQGAFPALTLLLAINMFNYLDRYILAAVLPKIQSEFFAADDPNALGTLGLLSTAFLVSYMVAAPFFGRLGDRMSRWWLIGIAVGVWSLASGASGLASAFLAMLITRIFVGIGEGGYGPTAPTLISDYFPIFERGQMMSFFYMAIPVGSALGYAFGGLIAERLGWRWPFYLVTIPGLFLAVLCFLRRDPREQSPVVSQADKKRVDYRQLAQIPSYVYNTVAMTAMTFALGGVSAWIPTYLQKYRGLTDLGKVNTVFGVIVVVTGFAATLCGGWLGDRFRDRYGGSYFLVSGIGMLIGVPCFLAVLFLPFPLAWVFLGLAVFFIFFNTGPSNTALANVTPAAIRATAFAVNIFFIHLLGDAFSPPLIGFIAGRTNFTIAFLLVAFAMLVSGVVWLLGARYLKRDTDAVSANESAPA